MFIVGLGAFFFGLLLGWVCYRTLRLKPGVSVLAEIAALIAALGGAAVLALYKSDVLFGFYATGLIAGYFAYFTIDLLLSSKQSARLWREILLPPAASPPIASPAPPAANGELTE